jgi:hypothetical protein
MSSIRSEGGHSAQETDGRRCHIRPAVQSVRGEFRAFQILSNVARVFCRLVVAQHDAEFADLGLRALMDNNGSVGIE